MIESMIEWLDNGGLPWACGAVMVFYFAAMAAIRWLPVDDGPGSPGRRRRGGRASCACGVVTGFVSPVASLRASRGTGPAATRFLIWKYTMKTRTIEDWRVTQLFIELEKRVEAHELGVIEAAARNADPGFIKLQVGKWYESQDALALVRSLLEESGDIKACIERIEK